MTTKPNPTTSITTAAVCKPWGRSRGVIAPDEPALVAFEGEIDD